MDVQPTTTADDSVYSPKIDGSSIRLLQLSRSTRGVFTGKLKIVRLNNAPPFFSASYVWGTKSYSNGTTIRLKSGHLPVLDSLEPFLRMIGTHDDFTDEDWWWIDSLSINLADGHEREQQVRIMGDIYRKSRRVVIWLGEEKEEGSDCGGALDFLHYLSEHKWAFNDDSEGQVARSTLRSAQYEAAWTAVGALLARPWWTRVWTLQEFILPREAKLCCGDSSISRGKFKSAMYSIFLCSTSGRDFELDLIPRPVFDAAFNRRRIHQWHANPQSHGINLVAIMAYLGNHSASDSRDRIYSVLGLITSRDRRMVGSPEYSSSVQVLYAKLVRSFWNEYKSLDIICFSHMFNRYADPLDSGAETAVPSWAPDWRIHSEFASPVPLMASQSASDHVGNFRPLYSQRWKAVYHAPGRELAARANIRFHDNLKEVWCDGVLLDTVDALGSLEGCEARCRSFVCERDQPVHSILQNTPLSGSTALPADFFEFLGAIARSLVLDRQDKYLRFEAPQHYVSDFLLLCNACLDGQVQGIDPDFRTWFHLNRSLRFGNQTLESLLTTILLSTHSTIFGALPPPTLRPRSSTYPPNTSADAESDDADTFLSRFQDTVRKKSRRLMVTSEEFVGMAPCRARLGDAVVVLFGCSIPLMLRRAGMREAWLVVGEAYVHGFMNGEVRSLVRKGTRSVRRFRLV